MKTLHFPSDTSVGTIFVRRSDGAHEQHEARGDIEVPPDAVVQLMLGFPPKSDDDSPADLAFLEELAPEALRELFLGPVQQGAGARLGRMRGLKDLRFAGPLDDDDLIALGPLALDTFMAADLAASGTGLGAVQANGLTAVALRGDDLRDDHVAAFVRRAPRLRVLTAEGQRIGGETVAAAAGCAQLQELRLTGAFAAADVTLLARLTGLERLSLGSGGLDDSCLEGLDAVLANLKNLALRHPDGSRVLSRRAEARVREQWPDLKINGVQMTRAGIAKFARNAGVTLGT